MGDDHDRLRAVVEFERGRADGYMWERDRFRDECLRLRAVVEAVGRYAESPTDETLAELLAARDALDGSGVTGEKGETMDDLIAESSLGTPEALARRAETPPATTAEILDGIDEEP